MKVVLKRENSFPLWKVYKDDKLTRWYVTKNQWGSGFYYALYYGKSFRGKYGDMNEVQLKLRQIFLEEKAKELAGF